MNLELIIKLATPMIIGTKIEINKLRYDVLEEELKELMQKVGDVENVEIFYDESGRSIGKAEVVFRAHSQAERAVTEYHGASIDEQAMEIKILGQVRTSQGRSSSADSSKYWSRGGGGRTQQREKRGKRIDDFDDEDLSNLKIKVSF